MLAWLGLVVSSVWQSRAERKKMRERLARRSTDALREMVVTWPYLVEYASAAPVREFRDLFDRADYAAILRRWRSLSVQLFALDDGPPSKPAFVDSGSDVFLRAVVEVLHERHTRGPKSGEPPETGAPER